MPKLEVVTNLISSMILVLVFYALVMVLSPIILHMSPTMTWALPLQLINLFPKQVLYMLLALFIVVYILQCLLKDESLASIAVFVVGSTALMFLLRVFEDINPGFILGRVEVIPGARGWILLLLVLLLASWTGNRVATAVKLYVNRKHQAMGQWVVMLVAGLFGLIPVFVYGAWLGEQIRSSG